ncbi:glycosyl hydrolase family 38 protein [Loa loa]|uniref:Alpha-mannosidase n=2 Tax=Loa loa TaxID=7209 RepID=A0A1S0UFD0_LOALO|nr:glycosyl hydrolase family 38 protein [Loa loa]EJD74390.1 glycosyl hydrolase family 38 protein [Loa loa]
MMHLSSGRLLAGVLSISVFVCLILYNSLETQTFEHQRNYEDQQLELEKLEKQINLLENDARRSGQLMQSMLKKVFEERQELKSKTSQRMKDEEKEKENVDGAAVGFLPPPKKAEQIKKEARNAEEAAQQKAQEEQAIHGVIHPPEEPRKAVEMPDNIGGKVGIVRQFLDRISSIPPDNMCFAAISMTTPDNNNIQMLDIYTKLPFDDPDGGVWKQGYDIVYSEKSVQREKRLEVIVVPHSHNDPGWIRTFEEYYETHTRNILNNMLNHLQKMDEMRFVYAEISFFERWWAEIDEEKRELVKGLLKSRKLEILTGGWVMPDEANSHYYGLISQLMEGHEWIRNHISEDYKPRNHWSIDPFGLSPTISYFMKLSNFSNGVLQRVHYSVKKYLAERKELEFMWRQLWGNRDNSTDFATHIMPFFSYDIPHTCGPDPKICCQFDFRRTPGGGLDCPWKLPAVHITENNIKERAQLLYDQYRKKAQLFKTNVVLVPLGDDFRYDTEFEWNNQYANYMKLFKYMNAQNAWNVNARFGTVDDYFRLVHERLHEDSDNLPVLSGDFFTYADRNDHYWSGYYTSRPFHKRFDRVLQHYIRTAEILYSFMRMKGLEEDNALRLFGLLVDARRWMNLFQHHDGIAGTSKDEVMTDYGQKMFEAIKKSEEIIVTAADFLLRGKASRNSSITPSLLMEENLDTSESLPKKRVVMHGSEIILFNPLGNLRMETICVHVNALNTIVVLASEPTVTVLQQISPVLEFVNNKWVIDSKLYELCFVPTIPPLSFQKYLFKFGTPHNKAMIQSSFTGLQSSDFDTAPLGNFTFDNGLISAVFDPKTGHLASVSLKQGKSIPVKTSFVWYGARMKSPLPLKGTDNPSGAYLFLPNGPAKPLKIKQSFLAIQGRIMQKVLIANDGNMTFTHIIKMPLLSPSIEIENTFHLDNVQNVELAMRLEAGIDNGDEFFTDLNGFQMVKRRRFKQLPLQAHFFPMSSSAFMEDETLRMTLLSAQPSGVANLASGQLDVMLDRRLNQDDGRGLFSGITDNRKTTSSFRLLFEVPSRKISVNTKARITAYHSMHAYGQMLSLLYPPVVLLSSLNEGYIDNYKLMNILFSCDDTHLITLRTLAAPTIYDNNSVRIHIPRNSYAVVLHRFGIDCRFTTKLLETCSAMLDMKRLFMKTASRVTETSLTMLYDHLGDVNDVLLEPMEVRTFRLDYI